MEIGDDMPSDFVSENNYDATNLYIKGLWRDCTQVELDDLFKKFGVINQSRVYGDGVGFVRFETYGQAEEARKGMNGVKANDKCTEPLMVRFAFRKSRTPKRYIRFGDDEVEMVMNKNTNNVYLRCLPRGFADKDLIDLCRPYGELTCTRLRESGVAFVRFKYSEDAARAIRELNGRMLPNSSQPLLTKLANSDPFQPKIGFRQYFEEKQFAMSQGSTPMGPPPPQYPPQYHHMNMPQTMYNHHQHSQYNPNIHMVQPMYNTHGYPPMIPNHNDIYMQNPNLIPNPKLMTPQHHNQSLQISQSQSQSQSKLQPQTQTQTQTPHSQSQPQTQQQTQSQQTQSQLSHDSQPSQLSQPVQSQGSVSSVPVMTIPQQNITSDGQQFTIVVTGNTPIANENEQQMASQPHPQPQPQPHVASLMTAMAQYNLAAAPSEISFQSQRSSIFSYKSQPSSHSDNDQQITKRMNVARVTSTGPLIPSSLINQQTQAQIDSSDRFARVLVMPPPNTASNTLAAAIAPSWAPVQNNQNYPMTVAPQTAQLSRGAM